MYNTSIIFEYKIGSKKKIQKIIFCFKKRYKKYETDYS